MLSIETTRFKHVSYLWDETKAAVLAGNEFGLLKHKWAPGRFDRYVSGPNNAPYGFAKAAQLHLSRLNAAELGGDHIGVNVVNPDAVIVESKIWRVPGPKAVPRNMV
jgi:NAD(P)-dependent dehydrogenase (short-subunit alcohol dehydrogenase family)